MLVRYAAPLAVAALLAVFVTGANASNGVPNPSCSRIPAAIVTSPDGTIVTDVVVRDLACNVVTGSSVTLDFTACTQLNLCAVACVGCTVNPVNHTVTRWSNAAGHAAFELHMGASSCPNAQQVRIYADGVLLGALAFASVDQDGDLVVTAADVAAVQALLGSHDLRADLDGDGTVTAADVSLVQDHLGAACADPTPARQGTWGALKSTYR